MSQPVHRAVAERKKNFKPDVIMSVVFAGNQFRIIQDEQEIDKQVSLSMNEEFWLNYKQKIAILVEAEGKFKKKAIIERAKEIIKKMKEDKNKSEELKAEIKERIKNLTIPRDLPETLCDARDFQQLLINTLGVLPANSTVMAAKKDQEEIFQHFDTSLGSAEQKSDKPYFAGPANEEELKNYKKAPASMKSDWQPALKFAVAHSNWQQDESNPEVLLEFEEKNADSQQQKNLKALIARSKPELVEPSQAKFKEVLKKVHEEAKKHPAKNYLVILFFASHGYNYGGMQAVATPYYDAWNDQLELIEVEKEIRQLGGKAKNLDNIFYWVQFASCREIKPKLTAGKPLKAFDSEFPLPENGEQQKTVLK